MGFTDMTFLFVFLPGIVILYLLSEKIFHNDQVNNLLLSLFSLFFYFWISRKTFLVYIGIVLFTYIAGKILAGRKGKRGFLAISAICLAGVLFLYKYAAYVAELLGRITGNKITVVNNLIVPLGLSFVIFEAISYVVDIYRGDAETGSLLDCFTFLSFFPKLVSGPIVLWKDYQPQLRNRRMNWDQVLSGVDRIIIGCAKKVILADSFGAQIALINSRIAGAGVDVPTMWIRALLYFFQLYFDFSGYSDIAIGLSQIFGFKVKENFRYPYLSKSITEFWRRWHISLGTWFREYVYIPLGGNRKGNVFLHLAIVFLLTGIWHGAGFCFLAWGVLHGLCVLTERAVREKSWYKKLPGIIKWLLTMGVVFFGWILFMSSDMHDFSRTIMGMFASTAERPEMTWQYFLNQKMIVLLVIAALSLFFGTERIHRKICSRLENPGVMIAVRVFLLFLFAIDIMFVVNVNYSPFLYFQF